MSESTRGQDVQQSIRDELHHKDEIIAALTSQLEQTVEQLDRQRRLGGERASRTRSENSSDLSGRLDAVLSEWSDVRPLERLLSIEQGVTEILEWLGSGQLSPNVVPPDSDASAETVDADFWEEAKARLLGSEPSEEASQPQPVPSVSEASDQPIEPTHEPVEQEPPPEPPLPVQSDADPGTLLEAVDARDAYISYLTTQLRLSQSRTTSTPGDWDALQNAPDELVERLKTLERNLKEQLKQAEIANSLERAALTRERAKLAQIKHHLEKQVLRLGVSPQGLEEASEAPPTKETQDRRWSRLFGR